MSAAQDDRLRATPGTEATLAAARTVAHHADRPVDTAGGKRADRRRVAAARRALRAYEPYGPTGPGRAAPGT
ncbi:hypothetical protein AB0L40_01595 [Patulibacter sp. NPDC049589]|uniref:hypothetical protein n=1 Tax=Patulibacter sp. NPDC049589 TaxID=3154731 RepID=UPI00343FB4AF